MNAMVSRGGRLICPAPHGQSPAMARKSIVLPTRGPATISTRSPGPIATSPPPGSRAPPGVATSRPVKAIWSSVDAASSMRGAAVVEAVHGRDGRAEAGDAHQRRPPVGDDAEIVDEPAQRLLHLVEGADRHHQLAEGQAPGEIGRRGRR